MKFSCEINNGRSCRITTPHTFDFQTMMEHRKTILDLLKNGVKPEVLKTKKNELQNDTRAEAAKLSKQRPYFASRLLKAVQQLRGENPAPARKQASPAVAASPAAA